MSLSPDRLQDTPYITIERAQYDPHYFLVRGEQRSSLNDGHGDVAFKAIRRLSEKAPDLVYAYFSSNTLMSEDYWKFNLEQRFAEKMHWLSQHSRLGDLLQWESHGVHVVGYKLTQALEIVDKRQPVEAQTNFRDWRILLPRIPRLFSA